MIKIGSMSEDKGMSLDKDISMSLDEDISMGISPEALHPPTLANPRKVRKYKKKTKITKTKRRKFLDSLREMPNVTRACRSIAVSRTAMYNLKNKNADFSAEWDSAEIEGTETLEQHAWNRATDEKKPSDILTIFMLKAHKPGKYRESVDITSGGKPLGQRITHILVSVPEVSSLSASDMPELPETVPETISNDIHEDAEYVDVQSE